jgi:MFS family permease
VKTSEPTPAKETRLSHAWRALRHRNFQLFFIGQGISVTGTWMTRLATSWLVYRLTHSAWLLGIVSFAGQIAAFALGPFAGVWVERLERRKLLVWTQALAAVQSLAMAALTLAGVITLWEIIALAALQGLINAFDMPARQSFMVQMVDDREDLANAIALNSSMVNAGRLIGPALAGVVVAAFGEGWCFLLDGVSYLAVIASLLLMRLRARDAQRHRATLLEQMREGWDYVRTSVPIRTILILFALLSLLGYSNTVLLPIFAGDVLRGGPHTLGWLSAALGVGALGSGISLTLRRTTTGLPRMLLIAASVCGIGLILFGLSHQLWLSMLVMMFIGFGVMQCAAVCNTLIQSLVTEDKRGRVMSYYTMAFFGASPFGSLFAGSLAHHIGAPGTVMLAGVLCLIAAGWYSLRVARVQSALEILQPHEELL